MSVAVADQDPIAQALDAINAASVQEFLSRDMSDKTRRTYKIVLAQFLLHAARWTRPCRTPSHTLHVMAQAFLDGKRFKTHNTFRLYKKTISAYYKWMYLAGHLPEEVNLKCQWRASPTTILDSDLKTASMAKKVMTEAEVRAILRYAKVNAPREHIAMLLMYNYGLRGGDILAIQRKHFKIINGQMHLWLLGKTGKQMRKGTFMRLADRDVLREICFYMRQRGLRSPNDYLYDNHACGYDPIVLQNGSRIPYSSSNVKNIETLNYHISKIIQEVTGKKLSSHAFRRSRITSLVKEGFDPYQVARLVRIQNINIIRKHYDKSDVMDKFASKMIT